MKKVVKHNTSPLKTTPISHTTLKKNSCDVPKEQIFSFTKPEYFETTISPLQKHIEKQQKPLKPAIKFPLVSILTQKFKEISNKFHVFDNKHNTKTGSVDNSPSSPSSMNRKRAKSSILDRKVANSLKGIVNGKILKQKISNLKSDSSNMRKSSISLFENFTGRKVSQHEYYAGSPLLNNKGKVEYYMADKKIDRIKRLQLHGKQLRYPFMIIPIKSQFKLYWDLLITFLIFLNSLLNPLEIAFQQQSNSLYQAFNLSVLVFYVTDIILSMRTTFYDENNDEILEGIELCKNYIKSKVFFIDLVSAIPLSEIIEYALQGTSEVTYIKFVNLFKFIRLLRLNRIFHYFKNDSYKIMFQIARITIVFIITFHWATCLWVFLITLQYDQTTSNDSDAWLPVNYRGILSSVSNPFPNNFVERYYENQTMTGQYFYALYSILLMVIGSEMGTVGVVQTLFAILICIIGSFFYAIFFSEVMLLISKLNYAYSLYQTKLDELDTKLEKNNIPLTIREKIHEYYNFYWKKQKIFQNLSDFSKLSESLKREILFFTHKDIVINVPLFHELEPTEILRIIQKLKTQIFLPQDLIIQEGQKGTEMFFLTEGLAEILIKKEDKVLSILLSKGSYFGEIALITNSLRTSDVKAIDFCIVEIFTKDDYEQLKLEYPDITVRLKEGLKNYKKNHLENIIHILEKNELFKEIIRDDLIFIANDYMNEIFIDPNEILLKPKKRTNALYFLLLGKMQIYSNTKESQSLLRDLIKTRKKKQNLINSFEKPEENNFFHCLDDDLSDFPHLFQDDCRLILNKIGSLNVGDMIGGIHFENNQPRSDFYYFTESACHFCVMTQASFEQLRLDRLDLFLKITENFNKSKYLYQKWLSSNQTPHTILSTSCSPTQINPLNCFNSTTREYQSQLNIQKAKKAIFFDDSTYETKKIQSTDKNLPMYSSTINGFQDSEKTGGFENKLMNNSVFLNHPIYEESSENSDREDREDESIKKEIKDFKLEAQKNKSFLKKNKKRDSSALKIAKAQLEKLMELEKKLNLVIENSKAPKFLWNSSNKYFNLDEKDPQLPSE